MKWVIQDKVFGDETDELIKHLADYEIRGSVKPRPPYGDGDIYRGSIEFVLQYGSKWLTLSNYSCDHYYPLLMRHSLLNGTCYICAWSNLKRLCLDELFPGHDRLFIRPNSGRKIFTGTTLWKKHWEKELEIIAGLPSTFGLEDETPVVVAPYAEIESEYRFLVGRNESGPGHEILDSACYAGDPGDLGIAFAKALEVTYSPDPVFTVDIAIVKRSGQREAKILELNSFVSAGLYDMDPGVFTRKVERILACVI